MTIPCALLTFFIVAAVLYYAIGYPSGFPWTAAFLSASILIATNAPTIVGIMRRLNISEKLVFLIESESLITGVLAITMFQLMLQIAHTPLMADNIFLVIFMFLFSIFVATLLGVCAGLLAVLIMKRLQDITLYTLSIFVVALITYILAVSFLHVAGAVAIFWVGMITGHYHRHHSSLDDKTYTAVTWDLLYFTAVAGLFLLVGVTINIPMFADRYLAMIYGVLAVVIGRIIAIYGSFVWQYFARDKQILSIPQQSILIWGGMRGDLAIALAFAIPLDLSYWYTIQSLVFGVVLFTLLIQAPTLPVGARLFGLNKLT